MNGYAVANGDPSMVWLGLGLLVIALVAIIVMLVDTWKNRGKPKLPYVSEQQFPPLPPKRRKSNPGGNEELNGAGPEAASNGSD